MPNLQDRIQSQLKELQERDIAQAQVELLYNQKRAQYIDNLTRILIEAGVDEETIEVKPCNPRGFINLAFSVLNIPMAIQQQGHSSVSLKSGEPLKSRRTLRLLPEVEKLSSQIAELVAGHIHARPRREETDMVSNMEPVSTGVEI